MFLRSFGITIVFLFIFLQISSQAQLNNLKFEKLTIEDGLSQNSSFCILQDHKGLMWFGTEDGLNRYDGYFGNRAHLKVKSFSHIMEKL